jgi:hypothetical protein
MGKSSKQSKVPTMIICDSKGNALGLGDKVIHKVIPGVFQITTKEYYLRYNGEEWIRVINNSGYTRRLNRKLLLKYPKHLPASSHQAFRNLAGF